MNLYFCSNIDRMLSGVRFGHPHGYVSCLPSECRFRGRNGPPALSVLQGGRFLPSPGLPSAVGASGFMSADDVDAGLPDPPRTGMPHRTLVKEDGGPQLLWIDGVLPLPVGARIELAEPRADGVVTRVRLAAARPGMTPTLVLDVKLDEAGGTGVL